MAKELGSQDKTTRVFLASMRVGLWSDTSFKDSFSGELTESVDWEDVYRLAGEQSVQGLVLQGIEWYKEHKPECVASLSQEFLIPWIGEVQLIEQQNKAMNEFVAKLIEKLRRDDVYAILVKGQGIAQCYERPLWRTSGDVDLLLSDANYEKAKTVLVPLAAEVEHEFQSFKHLGMTMDGGFVVELHGTMHSRISKRINRGIDEAQNDVFYGGNVRPWNNNGIPVFLPSPDNDVVFVFTHILNHYFIDGIGLRQICDWCRLLWSYQDDLDRRLLEKRIRKMGIMSEWRSFAALAVNFLGMPAEAMPLYSPSFKWKHKAERILAFMIESGNFGHNQKRKRSNSYFWKKALALWRKFKNFYRHVLVFPWDSIRYFCRFVMSGLDEASRRV